MIISETISSISPIFLSILLIIYLMIVELGNARVRKALLPFVIVLTLVFLVIAIASVYLTYINIK